MTGPLLCGATVMGATVTRVRGRSRPMPLQNRLKTSSAAAVTNKATLWRDQRSLTTLRRRKL